MARDKIGTRDTRREFRDACIFGGLATTDKLYFRDTGLYIRSSADGTLEIVSDGTLTLTATTEIRLNAPSVNVYHGALTVGSKDTASIVNVSLQINRGDEATAVAEAIGFQFYLSSDTSGQAVATAPTSLAVGTDGTILVESTANLVGYGITEADGDFDMNITDTASQASYVNVILPSGQKIISSAISWS